MANLLMRAFRFRVLWLAAALAGCAAAGCGPDGFQYGVNGQGPGHRDQQVALSSQQEVQLGKEAFEEVKEKEKDKVHLSGADYEQVKKIGDQVFNIALPGPAPLNTALRKEINLSDADPYGTPWNFNDREYAVIDSDEVNAFCLPAGKVVVFTGLMRLTDGKEDWLATVLGHEIAHALAHHASERIALEQKYGQASNATAGLQSLKEGDRLELLDLLGVGTHVEQYARQETPPSEQRGLFSQLRELKFDRQQEEEADHIGLFFMTFADSGYDPDQAVAFWQAMEEHTGGKAPPEILSDHPSDQHRIDLMQHWSARAKAAREAWQAGNVVK